MGILVKKTTTDLPTAGNKQKKEWRGEPGEDVGINGETKINFMSSSVLIFLRIGWLPLSILLFLIFPKMNFNFFSSKSSC